MLRDITDETIEITPEKFSFSGTSDGKLYTLNVELFKEIVPEECIKRNRGPTYECQLFKKEKEEHYWPRISKEKIKY